MRAELAKRTRKRFAVGLAGLDPPFKEVRGEEIPSGDRLFAVSRAGTTCFIHLEISPSHDRFNVSGGWSRSGCWPARLLPSEPALSGESRRFRIRALWEPSLCTQFWVVVPDPPLDKPEEWTKPPPAVEELIPKTDGLVDDALEHIREHVLPYFERVLGVQGQQGSSEVPR